MDYITVQNFLKIVLISLTMGIFECSLCLFQSIFVVISGQNLIFKKFVYVHQVVLSPFIW